MEIVKTVIVIAVVICFCVNSVVAHWQLTRAWSRIAELEKLLEKERGGAQSGNSVARARVPVEEASKQHAQPGH